jgi:hypothetical protein
MYEQYVSTTRALVARDVVAASARCGYMIMYAVRAGRMCARMNMPACMQRRRRVSEVARGRTNGLRLW